MPMRGTTIVGGALCRGRHHGDKRVAQDVKAHTPAGQEAPGWTAFRSPERGFEIAFPATPKSTSSAVAGQNPLIRYSFKPVGATTRSTA